MATRKYDRKTFKKGKFFLDYEILKLIGQGGFGDIYYVKEKDTENHYALKLQPKDAKKKFLVGESKVLKKLQHSDLFPHFVASGETEEYDYLVEEILGPSLATVRRLMPEQKFSMSTALRMGIEMLRLILTTAWRSFTWTRRPRKSCHRATRPGSLEQRSTRL